jgi:hypothetical protein
MTPDGITVMIKELEELLANFNSQQISIVKMSLNRYAEWIQKPDLSNVEKVPSFINEHCKHPARVYYISAEKKTEFSQLRAHKSKYSGSLPADDTQCEGEFTRSDQA